MSTNLNPDTSRGRHKARRERDPDTDGLSGGCRSFRDCTCSAKCSLEVPPPSNRLTPKTLMLRTKATPGWPRAPCCDLGDKRKLQPNSNCSGSWEKNRGADQPNSRFRFT